jgi:hypothetical protein
VTLLAWLYIATGTIGFITHWSGFQVANAFQFDNLPIELVELVAVISGAFMLRGHDWARWLALAWIAFHVVLSAFHSLSELAAHGLFCAVIAWILFRPEAVRYFRGAPMEPADN